MAKTFTTTLAATLRSTTGAEGQWIHVIPAGTFQGRDGRGPFTLADPEAVIRQTWKYAGPRKIPVDYDHQLHSTPRTGQRAIAAGWITRLETRSNGIWGLVEWTPAADAHIASGEYRYLSPAIVHGQDGTITRLLSVSLTNNPNLNELTALFSTSTDTATMEQLLEQLRNLTGLAPDADQAAVMDAIGKFAAKSADAVPDPAQYVPIAEFERVLAERNALSQGVSKHAALEHVETQIRKSNMPAYLKDWGVALCCVNRPAFDAFIDRTKGFFNDLVTEHSAFKSAVPGERASTLSTEEQATCRRMGITPEEFLASKTFIESRKA